MQQVFALEIDAGAAQRLRQVSREVKRRGTPCIGVEQLIEFGLKRRIRSSLKKCSLEFF